MIDIKWAVTAVAVFATVSLTACSTSGTRAAKVLPLTATVTASSSIAPPAPSTAIVRVPVTKTRTVVPTVTVQAPQPPVVIQVPPPQQVPIERWPGHSNPDYPGYAFGTFHLTKFAYPGPIHSYFSPTDTSSFVETIPATSWVTVYCSVVGENLQNDPYWDWNGSGWVWDHMVDISGNTPPSC